MRNKSSCALNEAFDFTTAAADARRFARRNWYAAETFFDDVCYAIKREPLKAVGVTFGVALGVGALAGWFTGRNHTK